jgi:hypothetical protein
MTVKNVIDHLEIRLEWANRDSLWGNVEVFSEAIRYLKTLPETEHPRDYWEHNMGPSQNAE